MREPELPTKPGPYLYWQAGQRPEEAPQVVVIRQDRHQRLVVRFDDQAGDDPVDVLLADIAGRFEPR